MANKQISDLQARTFDGDSIIPHDVENTDPSTMSQYPYLTGSATGHAVADFVGNGEIYTTDLNTVDKHINGAINELHAINGYSYDAYDDTATYAVGDLCIYNNALYKCTTAITTAEAWNASHWTATSIADEISELNSGKLNYINTLWANSIESNYTRHSQFIIQHNAVNVYLIWFASTNDINVCAINESGINAISGTGSVTIQSSGVTITRTNKSASETNIYKVKVQLDNSSSNGAFTIIY